jgi:hypothetical protein
MTARWRDVVDQALQSELESLLVASGVRYRRDERLVPYHVITYDLETRENEELRLSLELVSDQLNVCFNDCYLMVEHEAYTSRFGRNPSSMAEWRGECAETGSAGPASVGAVHFSGLWVSSGARTSTTGWHDRPLAALVAGISTGTCA